MKGTNDNYHNGILGYDGFSSLETTEARDRILALSADNYISALRQIDPNDDGWRVLLLIFAAPDHELTAGQIASAMGWKDYRETNRKYGKFASGLCKKMEVLPLEYRNSVLVEFNQARKPIGLRLRPAVIQAIEILT
jgi:hypothetical protein